MKVSSTSHRSQLSHREPGPDNTAVVPALWIMVLATTGLPLPRVHSLCSFDSSKRALPEAASHPLGLNLLSPVYLQLFLFFSFLGAHPVASHNGYS